MKRRAFLAGLLAAPVAKALPAAQEAAPFVVKADAFALPMWGVTTRVVEDGEVAGGLDRSTSFFDEMVARGDAAEILRYLESKIEPTQLPLALQA